MEILVCVKRVPAIGGVITLADDGQAVDTRMSWFAISPHEECAESRRQRLSRHCLPLAGGNNERMRMFRVKVVRRVPHPGRGFTQGLLAEPGDQALESTGRYGQSSLRRYRLGAGQPHAQAPLPGEFFAEGICQVGTSIWQLTWKERKALRWDAATLELREVIDFNRDGWGACATGSDVVTSDGTSELVRRDPVTLAPREVIRVRCDGSRVPGLNDLAWAGGRVWANIACTSTLAGIDLATGEVTDLVDARAAGESFQPDPQHIMNGIAALPGPGEFLLTGKGWRWIRQVRLIPARGRATPERLFEGAGKFS
jgi:glutaminyl-peptide cyclotransferase